MAGEAIFIGYRRDDTADVAGRIYDALEARFGRERVFKDVDNIPVGANFGHYIKTILPRCRVALILIGPNWVGASDGSGARRLADPNDWVRIEVETALATPDLQVVPVLVNGAQMPRAEDLPATLQPILHLNAAVIRRDPDFRDDIERLGTALRASVRTGLLDLGGIGGARKPQPPRQRGGSGTSWMIGAIAGAIALAALGFGVSRWLPIQGAQPAQQQTATMDTAPATTMTTTSAVPAQGSRSEVPVNTAATVPAPPVQARVEEPVRAPPPTALPEMVRIPGRNFEVSRYEVTFGQWGLCVAEGGCNGFSFDPLTGYELDRGWSRDNLPVFSVTWHEAQAYAQWLSRRTNQRYRLLTSEEWEYAARAGTTTTYSWGNERPVCDRSAPNGANFRVCGDYRPRPVGFFRPNGFGLYDMHGNVFEWVADCYDSSCTERVLRSGNWDDGRGTVNLPLAGSWHLPASSARGYSGIGFRVARTV